MPKVKDLTGSKFGRWTVLSMGEETFSPIERRLINYDCQCACGSIKSVRAESLRSGASISCGCFRAEELSQRNKGAFKNNKYDFKNEYVIGYTANGKEFYFDAVDYETISNYCWHINGDGYVCAVQRGTGKNIKMHQLVMHMIDKTDRKNAVIDHINRNKVDNRKENLRICTNSFNQMNKGLRKDTSSGHIGVSFHKRMNKWVSYLYYNNQRVHYGQYDTKEEAIKTRKQAEELILQER